MEPNGAIGNAPIAMYDQRPNDRRLPMHRLFRANSDRQKDESEEDAAKTPAHFHEHASFAFTTDGSLRARPNHGRPSSSKKSASY